MVQLKKVNVTRVMHHILINLCQAKKSVLIAMHFKENIVPSMEFLIVLKVAIAMEEIHCLQNVKLVIKIIIK